MSVIRYHVSQDGLYFYESEEDSMDESKVKEAAIDYLAKEYGYTKERLKTLSQKGTAYENIGSKLFEEFEQRVWDGKFDDDARLAILAIAPLHEFGDYSTATWYPDPKPQAKLILDECGVKTYEVNKVASDLYEELEGNYYGAGNIHVTKIPVSGGAKIQITSDDLSGVFRTFEHDTAKQALESLGYEVAE